jgi:hypothetical protein|tara:strand:+ start:100 stop:318 length:219 start_codon:yes stop_codon:yes gene_type:complete
MNYTNQTTISNELGELSEVEKNLLNDLNYKASLILELEKVFADKKVPVNTKSLYSFTTKELETVRTIWTAND